MEINNKINDYLERISWHSFDATISLPRNFSKSCFRSWEDLFLNLFIIKKFFPVIRNWLDPLIIELIRLTVAIFEFKSKSLCVSYSPVYPAAVFKKVFCSLSCSTHSSVVSYRCRLNIDYTWFVSKSQITAIMLTSLSQSFFFLSLS